MSLAPFGRLPVVAVIGLALCLTGVTLDPAASVMQVQIEGPRTALAAPDSRIALGAFIANAPGDAKRIDEFASSVGKMPAIVHWYQAWEMTDPSLVSRRWTRSPRVARCQW